MHAPKLRFEWPGNFRHPALVTAADTFRHVKNDVTIGYDLPPLRSEKTVQKAEKTILLLLDKDIKVSLQTVVIPEFLEKLNDLLAFSKSLELPHRLIPGSNNLGRSQGMNRLTYMDILNFGMDLPGKAYWEVPLWINPELPYDTSCGWNSYRCEVCSDGSVTYCGGLSFNFPQENVGNLKTNNFEEIWKSSERLKFIREIVQEDFKEPCKSCEFFNRCYGSCRASAVGWLSDFYAAHPLCHDKYLLEKAHK